VLNEVDLSLTTPVIRDEDAVFPGENWFFYWKTSASLWRSKIESMTGFNKLLVPINWSFHSETGDNYDFADEKPETDLKKLVTIADELGKQIIFLVPMSPCPFLPNGGLPALLARTSMVDDRGRYKAFVDQDGTLNKMFSFFDPRVYKAYGKFTNVLGQYFSQTGISSDVWGMDCGQISLDGFQSTLKDFSPVFQQGFGRFLASKKDELQGTGEAPIDGVMTPDQEHRFSQEFLNVIRSVYAESCESGLAGNWEGSVRVGFIGGSDDDFFRRLNQKDRITAYTFDLLESLSLNALPTSLLLPGRLKKGILGRMFRQLVSQSFSEHLFSEHSFEDDGAAQFKPKRFFEVYDLTSDIPPDTVGWADLGLWDYLQKYYSWCYCDRGDTPFEWREDSNMDKIFFFHGINMNQKLFHNILKTFMSGGKVILNRSGLSREYQKKLEAFFLENDLDVEKVKVATTIYNASLGEGRFLIFEGDSLLDLDDKKISEFWHKVLTTFKTNHLMVLPPEGVQVTWRERGCNTNELNYEEVRRMDLYNPSSYKKKMKFSIPDNFRLLKVVDEEKVTFQHGQKEIEIDFLPEGSLSLDFGVFS
jgi:hypothetical protein